MIWLPFIRIRSYLPIGNCWHWVLRMFPLRFVLAIPLREVFHVLPSITMQVLVRLLPVFSLPYGSCSFSFCFLVPCDTCLLQFLLQLSLLLYFRSLILLNAFVFGVIPPWRGFGSCSPFPFHFLWALILAFSCYL